MAMDRSVARRLGWPAAVVLTTLVTGLLPVLVEPRHYFYGDTAAAYYGWWYHLGDQVRAGHLPQLVVDTWGAGNPAAEGQWGLWSPLVIGIGLLTTVVGDVLVLVTCVKLVLLCAGALGVYSLARSYAVPRPAAYVAGVVAPLGGMSHFVDGPSWAAGLMIWALVPWVWWALRRLVDGSAGPAAALVLGYLLVTIGYVYGTIALAMVLLACLLDALQARNRAAVLRTAGCGVVLALVAVAVYLPGVLTEPVTNRGDMLEIPGKFTTDPPAMLASLLPTSAVPGVTEGLFPFAYTVWFLPLLLWTDLPRLRRGWRPLAGLCLFGAVYLGYLLGPETIGPLRWPLRVQPFLVLAVVLLTVVVLSHYRVDRVSRARLLAVLAWVGAAGVVAVVRAPQVWPGHVVAVLVVGGAVAAYWWLVRAGRASGRAVAAGAVLVTLGLLVLQSAVFEPSPSPRRNLPTQVADYRDQAAGARGAVLVVGDAETLLEEHPAAADEVLLGSAWYLNRHRVVNSFTAINHRGFYERFCVRYQGATCPELLDTLFTREPHTGARRVDLLAVSSLLLLNADVPAARREDPPPGWHVVAEGRWTTTWVRDRPVPSAGGPVWTSPGLRVTTVDTDGRDVTVRVDRVPRSGGTLVLSRLPWPGYRVTGARVAAPTDGYLLTLRVPPTAQGRTVTAAFSPPGWRIELAAWWAGVLAMVAWIVAHSVRSRHRRRGGRASVTRRRPRPPRPAPPRRTRTTSGRPASRTRRGAREHASPASR